jgi:hypothetical protein
MIPVAVGYLFVGTGVLLSTVPGFPTVLTFPAVVHFYATGFVALSIFALGCRLVTGFFHVTPPRSLSWPVLVCGAVAPGVLATNFWRPPWFVVGAGLEAVAVIGYAALVGVVAYRTDRRRIGLYGVAVGALAGAAGVSLALAGVLGVGGPSTVAAHVPVVLDGFLLATIVGYAYQFFPVTNGQFYGATDRTALATILLLACGTGVHATGIVVVGDPLRASGAALAALGTGGYAYLIVRRLA